MNLPAIKKIVKLGLKSLWLHKLRSMLTTLGIVFGVCSVIAMLAIGEGASQEAQAAIERLGSRNLIIETVEPPNEQADNTNSNAVQSYGLTYADAESMRNSIANIEVTVPIREIDQEARYANRKTAVKVIGTVPWYTEISPVHVISGRFLASVDLQNQQSVCVADEAVAKQLFAFEDPIGKNIKIQKWVYRIIGLTGAGTAKGDRNILKNEIDMTGSAKGATGNIYIPLTTARNRFGELTGSISGGNRKLAKVELQKITVQVKSPEDILVMRSVINAMFERLHSKKDFRIVVPLELLRQAAKTKRIFSIVLGSIAAISLLVGGIGIMNIMLATVSERTREIGIRRALGATKRDIIVQFLSETLLLTFVGGLLGTIVGTIIPFLVSHFGQMPTIITYESLVLAFGISASVGVGFGLYPAYRAANMDPIESLRHE